MEGMKLYFVKKEVLARNIVEAAKAKGRIYEISLAADKDQPESFTKVRGFKPKHGKDETK